MSNQSLLYYGLSAQYYRHELFSLPPPFCCPLLQFFCSYLRRLQGRESADLLGGLSAALEAVAAAEDHQPEGVLDSGLAESTQKSRITVLKNVHFPHQTRQLSPF